MRSVLRVATGNAVINLISLANGVLFTGFLSRLVTVENFAAWSWINSAVGICAISDMYLLLFIQNLITRNFVLGKRKFADFMFRSMFILQLLFAAILGAFVVVCLEFVRENKTLGYEDGGLLFLFVVALAAQLLSQALGIFGAYYSGRGDSDKSNLMLLIKSIAQNILIIFCCYVGASFEVSVLLFFISGPLFLALHYAKGNAHYRPHAFQLKWRHIRWVLAYLWRRAKLPVWGTLRVVDAVRNNIPLVLGYFALNSTSIADYVFVSRLNVVALTVASGVFGSFIPKIVSMQIKNDKDELTKVVIKGVVVTTVLGLAYCLAMLLMADRITSIWAGREVLLASSFVLAVALSGVVQVIQSLLWNVVIGLNDIKALLKSSFLACVVTVGVLVVSIHTIDANALPISVFSGSVAFCIFAIASVRSLSRNNSQPIKPKVLSC